MAALRSRIDRWWQSRHPRTDTWVLTQHNVYILPTKAGLVFAGTLVIMLLASINYQLNLGYVLTFLLAGSGLVSMHLTHGTLRGLTLHLRPAAAAFAGQPAALDIVVTNPGAARHGLATHFQDRSASGPSFAWCDVPAMGQATLRVSFVPQRRGLHEVPALTMETHFPLGLFRAWTLWRPATQVLAWPRPEVPAPPLPAAMPMPGERRLQTRSAGGSELDGVRPWRRGDTLRQVAWKKVARSGELISRQMASSGAQELWLDWGHALLSGRGLDGEQRLSRLAAWVLAADRSGVSYGLRLPHRELPAAMGDAQRLASLEALALMPS
jgi:uncharacterized protein (DUF58 family)